MPKFRRISPDRLPKHLSWDIERQNQGQIVEVWFAVSRRGTEYRCLVDRSLPLDHPERTVYKVEVKSE